MSGEGDLDPTEGHSKPTGGTLPLTDQGPADSVSTEGGPQEKHLPPGPSEAEGQTSTDTPPKNTSDSPPDQGDNSEKRVQNLVKSREETVTTPPPKESDYPFKDHPEAPLGAEDGSVIPPVNRTQHALQITHSLDSGQAEQLVHQIKTKEDIDG